MSQRIKLNALGWAFWPTKSTKKNAKAALAVTEIMEPSNLNQKEYEKERIYELLFPFFFFGQP